MAAVDDVIKQWLQEAERSGELKRNPHLGKPFDFDDGFLETPARLRMAYKVLRNAGYVPAEIELLNEIAALRETLEATTDEAERKRLLREIAEKRQRANVMIERVNRKRS